MIAPYCYPPMSYEPLHHKYRPQTFAQLVGQEAIALTLTNAIINCKIAPAYLFTGPRGTGKTSSARILAKSLNCLSSDLPTPNPCGKCEVCKAIAIGDALDVIEIDAASNTGVDNIREIIERAQFAPVQCRYKVYVIDECHMLTTQAFNALLKTLEEPPSRVVFILATTEPHRVLPTIISRCQRFDYRRISNTQMEKHLQKIAELENITINSEAITVIAQLASGGLRDAQSLLAQLSLLSLPITPESVWDVVGVVSEQDLLELIKIISENRPEALIEKCRAILNRGREPIIVLQNLANFYLNLLLIKTAPTRSDLLQLTPSTQSELLKEANKWQVNTILNIQQHLKNSELLLKNTTSPGLWLEISLLELLLLASNTQPPSEKAPSIPPLETKPSPSLEKAPEKARNSTTTSKPLIKNIYTDGVCLKDGETGGWAIVVNFTDGDQEKIGGAQQQTNREGMKLQAAIAALKYWVDRKQKEPITIFTDSEALRKNIKDEKNQDLWKSLEELNSEQVTWQYEDYPEKETVEAIAIAYATEKLHPENVAQLSSSDEDFWQNVVQQIQPNATQILVRQHCCLISFAEGIATVGVRSQELLKNAKNKIKNIEKGFEAVCKQKIKVNLQVGYANKTKPSAITRGQISEPNISGGGIQPRDDEKKMNNETKEIEDKQENIEKKYNLEEIKKMALNFAQFFEGEVIIKDN